MNALLSKLNNQKKGVNNKDIKYSTQSNFNTLDNFHSLNKKLFINFKPNNKK